MNTTDMTWVTEGPFSEGWQIIGENRIVGVVERKEDAERIVLAVNARSEERS